MSARQGQAETTELLCSVIVPVYNGAGVIARCLDALAAQTVAPDRFEVIVVDDGSRDGTGDTVAAWAAQHPFFTLRLATQANTGPAGARNYGARLARSPLLLFTDADCIPVPGWMAAFLAAFADMDVAGAMGAYRSRQTAPAARFAQLEFEERYALMQQRASIDLIATYSAAYRRAVFLEAGGFHSALPNNEDVELAYRLSEQGRRLVFVPGAQVEHEHDATWAGYVRTKIGRGYWRTLVYRRHPGKVARDGYTPQALKAQVALAPLAIVGILLAGATRRPGRLSLALPFLASALPLARRAWQSGQPHAGRLTLWALWGAWLRALAFGVGVGLALASGRDPVGQGRRHVQKEQVAP